jgi:DNA polymerase elongation subunit (family B)
MFDSVFDWSKVPDGSIHCDDIREYLRIHNNHVITPPESKLNIFSPTRKILKPWKSKVTLEPYENLSKVYLDIETLRVPDDEKDIRKIAKRGKIMMIGIRNEKGKNIIFRDESEARMIQDCFRVLDRKKPDILLTYNGIGFDLPYLHERALILGIKSPFYINYEWNESTFGAANIAGRYWDAKFRPVFCEFGGKKCPHVDIYQLAIGWDSVLRKFTEYSLKSIPIQLGLRDDERLDLGVEGIEECYRLGDWDTLATYLEFDLEDTEKLGNFFMPSLYYQKVYFPAFTIQQLSYLGNATKWGSVLEAYYGKEYTEKLPDPRQYSYQGAITHAVAGLHIDVAGCDFSGQYPSCMLMYGIHSQHDPDMHMNSVMGSAVEYRGTIKYKKNLTKEDEDLATAVKPVINSGYGSLGSHTPFGDSLAAATVTIFARARIKWAWKFVESMGGQVVLSDTDSVYVKTSLTDIHKKYPISEETLKKLPSDASPRLLGAVAIVEQLKANIPSGAKLDLEAVNRVLFVPPATIPEDYNKSYKFKSVNGKKYIYKLFGNHEQIEKIHHYALENFGGEKVTFDRLKLLSDKFDLGFPQYESIRKNYVKIDWNAKKQTWILKAKGRYVKRDRTYLEKMFQQRYLSLYAENPRMAEDYYYETVGAISSGQYDKLLLTITRKIRIGEKTIIKDLGGGKARDIVSYYQGANGKPTIDGDYDIEFYLDKLNRMYQEIQCMIALNKPVSSLKEEVEQLVLF